MEPPGNLMTMLVYRGGWRDVNHVESASYCYRRTSVLIHSTATKTQWTVLDHAHHTAAFRSNNGTRFVDSFRGDFHSRLCRSGRRRKQDYLPQVACPGGIC